MNVLHVLLKSGSENQMRYLIKSTISLPFTDCFEMAQKEMFP